MQGSTTCPFGQAFLQVRTAHSISQWTVALRTQYHIRNIQRIERGEHQPGVMLALRLVAAADADVGSFFQNLSAPEPRFGGGLPFLPFLLGVPVLASTNGGSAEIIGQTPSYPASTSQSSEGVYLKQGEDVFSSLVNSARAQPDYEKVPCKGVKCLFGPFFHQARLTAGLSQAVIAQKVQYNLRNISAVEKGRQEPGVMVALNMVAATGMSIREFFSTLHSFTLSRLTDSETMPSRLKQ